jgi:protein-L-isoaspartate(D-aspartate) O-methyltransferase
MARVPREQFVPDDSRPLAYADRAVPIGAGRFLTAPAAVGQLLTQMMPEPGQRALVVAAGTGYSAALFAAMGLSVVAVERSPELAARAREFGIEVVEAAPEGGHPAGAPYDQILIDGAVDMIPEAIVAQLADSGRLGAALIDRGITRLIVGRKSGDAFGYLSIGDAGVPALPGFTRPKAFTF